MGVSGASPSVAGLGGLLKIYGPRGADAYGGRGRNWGLPRKEHFSRADQPVKKYILTADPTGRPDPPRLPDAVFLHMVWPGPAQVFPIDPSRPGPARPGQPISASATNVRKSPQPLSFLL